ncbi:Z1 domain-containing protein [Tistlia consotensis]|uniref:Z1 domain-containing protein n=1 Tax=Tistlia consotensis USBA 355 TaxID=560819 RepID=A0A1Y6B7I3_9PROT|nr:Z1 domain-containing protein [Tistlia consotensis]SME97066.1 Z1 domain-containing protein [Tistlia consotensis USBA 355]SNR56495.1 Z1 domain-containing protein [Tistlia consotensis]
MEFDVDRLVGMAQAGLRLEPPPSEEEIAQILNGFKTAFGLSEDVVEQARRQLHATFELRMELGETIEGEEEHTPWLAGRLAQIEPFYWERYRKFLARSGWGPNVLLTLDRSLNNLLGLLGDPANTHPWKRRGLVVGDVQSGKTATYAGLINKASDAGYRMIILLTGTLENVRRQTQERLDAAFVGFDSRDYLTTGQLQRKRHVGVGLIDGQRDGVVFTSRDKDFRKNTATALNISLDSVKDPVLVVSKKNKAVLERLASWLRARNADREGRIDLPLLLIDDEADNASINTKSTPDETTAINRAIRDLLTLFRRSSYVGFTATPFANIFIDPDTTDEWIDDDLFPRDFIHILEPPSNYIGMDRLFPPLEPDDEEGAGERDDRVLTGIIQEIEDEEDWLPLNHKKDVTPGPLPDSLGEALNWFLLTCSIRDLRADSGYPGGGGPIHRSMLVNVSRFTATQDLVASDLQLELERIQLSVRHHGAKRPDSAEASSKDIAKLKEVFDIHGADCEFSWSDVLARLHESIASVQVQPINQRTGSAVLDYGSMKGPPGIRVIAVGGNSLSRGITLEGLTISYFLRNSKAYDTLLQMGRWFGYRDGYGDLCRIWMSPESEGWYRHITLATEELKRDFRRMRTQRATPREFGLRVRTHPDTLIITARNKMATGMDVVAEVQEVSLSGRGIETSRVHRRPSHNAANLELVGSFVEHLLSDHSEFEEARGDTAYLWEQIPATQIADFVERFLVHPLNHDFQGESIAEHLRNAANEDAHPWTRWNVALMRQGSAGPDWLAPSFGRLRVTPKMRVVRVRDDTTPKSVLLSGNKARVGGSRDVLCGLTKTEEAEALERARERNPTSRRIPEDDARFVMRNPLLIIYLVRGALSNESYLEDGMIMPALALHFPGERDPNAKKRYVRYRLNRVAQEDYGLLEDEPAVDEDVDD